MFIGVSPKATSAEVLMIIVAAPALGPDTGNLISAATDAYGFSTTVAGAAARAGSVCHSVHCHHEEVFQLLGAPMSV